MLPASTTTAGFSRSEIAEEGLDASRHDASSLDAELLPEPRDESRHVRIEHVAAGRAPVRVLVDPWREAPDEDARVGRGRRRDDLRHLVDRAVVHHATVDPLVDHGGLPAAEQHQAQESPAQVTPARTPSTRPGDWLRRGARAQRDERPGLQEVVGEEAVHRGARGDCESQVQLQEIAARRSRDRGPTRSAAATRRELGERPAEHRGRSAR